MICYTVCADRYDCAISARDWSIPLGISMCCRISCLQNSAWFADSRCGCPQ